ncbi:HpcH/HpaI aldolase [Caballeronia hypogeia]|uniref:HpcH/HpaI aldolase n=1 Tax=Caballeronia hypogeia TaxID=1777140 RepID=A0A158DP58_9BURK|nr:CoA ester lyase [Caballeronia hypogeia]SAK96190.1 HpcH/HpaI aldolase [Caballeronia hypogeia]
MPTFNQGRVQSLLFVPGDRPERFDKALGSGACSIIVDLEDAVAPGAKMKAREIVSSWASGERPVLLRINGRGTPWFADDLALRELPGVAGIVLPKTESSDDVSQVTDGVGRNIDVYPLIETAAGMSNVREIVSTRGVRQLLFGTLDFQVDMNIQGDAEELDAYRASLVLASKVAGIRAPIDGVTPAIDDPERIARDALNSKRRGFAGKLCIHPKQVPIVNAVFRPSEAELDWARRVLAAVAESRGAVVSVDGKMVDRPVVLQAEQILVTSGGIGHAA